MDPITLIGAIASVAGLVDLGAKLCFTLHDMAKVFSSAPETIVLMDKDVSSLRSVLQQLQSELEKGNSHGLDLPRETRINLQNILESCELVFASLKTTLDKFTNYPKKLEGAGVAVIKINSIKIRFRWMMEESEVVRIRKSLQTHVQTLQLTLTTTTALVVALVHDDTTYMITLLEDLHSNLKRTVTITSETVVGLQVQTPFQSIIHNPSTTSTAPQGIEPQMAAAVITDQGPDEELLPGPSAPSNDPISAPTGEINEPGSVQIKPPDPQHASVSRLTVSNQENHASKRRRPVIAVPGETLFVAARAGNKNIFLQILQTGAKITEVEADGTTVLQAAAEANSLDVVLSLLFFGANPNLGGGRTGSPLIAGTNRQHIQVVAALLEAEANPGAFYPDALPWMRSAFHCALYHKNLEILSMLLGVGADPNGVPGLLQYACSAGTFDSVKQLLDAKLNVNNVSDDRAYFGTGLQVAVSNKRTDVVEFLLERQADPNIICPTSLPWQRSPLFQAVHAKDSRILSILLGKGADVTRVPGLLHYACSVGTLDSIQQLLNTDLDVNGVFDNSGFFGTPLQVSVFSNRVDIVRLLLKHGADPNITVTTLLPWQRSPLFKAVYAKNSEILSILLNAGADVNRVPGLLHYACSVGTLKSVEQLLVGDLDINQLSNERAFFGTPLQVAVSNSRTDIVRFLLERKADPNITATTLLPWQRSPLFEAAHAKNAEILSMLLGANADPKHVPGLLPYVAENNDLRFVKIMVEEGKADIDSVDEALGTALQVFAAKGQRDALVYLLDLGADPNIGGGRFGSPINAAMANGHEGCTKELLS
ncbi:ankyrin repeat-containing domain protein [Ilyonectria sp. MPI-CAGE-AT-0026]|nr:ankyrin repeat-containing domain protein [Ilyonectria sp. MPI-CAGE-AT-0026]